LRDPEAENRPMTASRGRARLAEHFADYARYHRDRTNLLCHEFGIPMIMIALFGLLGSLTIGPGGLTGHELFRLDAGILLIGFAAGWFLLLDWRLGAPFGLISLGLYFLARALPSPALWALFGVGWALQLVGHSRFERNRPAFTRNLAHVLIGPLWIFAKAVGYREGR
jgi:uncharacterized membrane protein YGL010W